jgi:hypothetical protein
MPGSTSKKYKTTLCDNKMSFQECELAILRSAVDETEKIHSGKIANSAEVKQMISILENFLISKRLICYGGTAINNILPVYAQFYNKDLEVPDYDFFSKDAIRDAKELTDIYYKNGYKEVEAKSGVHHGTFKVFVNFIPMADITYLNPVIFDAIQKEAVTVAGIRYAPPNYLRMAMYLELSRPAGDVSRWEKVLKRLTLLNTYYPLNTEIDCHTVDFQRGMENHADESERLYFLVRDSLVEQGVVFFGGFASTIYSKYMPKDQQMLVKRVPDFDVLAENPERAALIVKENLVENGFKNVQTIFHSAIGEIIPENVEITVDGETMAFIYQPVACHNYNKIRVGQSEINVATIDTMLSFYLAFLYADKPYFNKDRILCMAKFLFDVQEKNRLEQKGVLKRFSTVCYGKQPTLESMRAEKTAKYAELAGKKGTPEYEMWFMKYSPGEMKRAGPPRAEEVGVSHRGSRVSASTVVLDKSLVYSKGAKTAAVAKKTRRKPVGRDGLVGGPGAFSKKQSAKKRRGWRRRKTNSFFNIS